VDAPPLSALPAARPRAARPKSRLALALAALALALGAAAAAILLLAGGSRHLVPAGGNHGDGFDPLAYRTQDAPSLQAGAAASLAHVVYVKSPGGIVASAARTAALRPQIEAAARNGPIDADTLEAIVLLESAGRTDVIGGTDPRDAVGVTQIVADTGSQLLGMRVDLPASRRLGRQIAAAHARHDARRETRLRARRARVDQRFDPAASLAATERYLSVARARFGREDLAVESYHMGIGNLERAVRLFAGSPATGAPVARLVADGRLDYARLYFDSSPIDHPAAYRWLSQLGDDSATYLWRLQAAKAIMAAYRQSRAQLQRLAALHAGDFAEHVLLPPGSPTFDSPQAISAARASGRLVAVPGAPQAARGGLAEAGDAALRPEALALALYLAAGVRAIAPGATPLNLTFGAVDSADVGSAARSAHGLFDGDPIHATGDAFDVERRYSTPAEAHAFQFMLDRLAALDIIAWARRGPVIEVVVGPGARRLLTILPASLRRGA